jgi:hypothetical protein
VAGLFGGKKPKVEKPKLVDPNAAQKAADAQAKASSDEERRKRAQLASNNIASSVTAPLGSKATLG